jgi:hypothetical protein
MAMTAERSIVGLLLALRLTLPLTTSRNGGSAAQWPMSPAPEFDPDWIMGKLEYEEDGHEPTPRRRNSVPRRRAHQHEVPCTTRR